MHGGITPEPPAIVAETELDERQLIQAIASAAIRDNFAVGRYALQWCEHYSHDKNDATLAKLINATNINDEPISRDYITKCRLVAKCVHQCTHLSWTHHWTAVHRDKKNAQVWLEKAAANGWSTSELDDAIINEITRDGPHPDGHRAKMRELREFLRDGHMLADRAFVRAAIQRYGIPIANEHKAFTKKLKAIRRNIDFLLEKIPGMVPATEREEG